MRMIVVMLCFFFSAEAVEYQFVNDSVHVLTVSRNQFSIVPARALDKPVGRETVLSLAERKGAIAAVNGGFFDIGGCKEGLPCGILKINGEWYGLPSKPRGAMGWNEDAVIFDRVLTHLEGIDFHVDPQIDPAQDWAEMDHIVGGAPLLIHHGQRIDAYISEKIVESFIHQKHARTAVGILPNRDWVFVVVDRSEGMTLAELTDFMEALGCIEALNLDGGGSSTLVYKGEVLNETIVDPIPVSDAILILNKNHE